MSIKADKTADSLTGPLHFWRTENQQSETTVPILNHFLLAPLWLDVSACNARNPPSINVFMLYVKIQQQQRSWWFRKLKYQNSVSRFIDNNIGSRQHYKKEKTKPKKQASTK